jgi:hypothetical protein
MTSTLIVGGSGGLGSTIAQHFADRGDDVVLTSRDTARAETVAARIGCTTRWLALDLARPDTISTSLDDVTDADNVVITAVGQAGNTLAQFGITDAVSAVTMKLVGYAETVRAARPFHPGRIRRAVRRTRQGAPLPRLDHRQHLQRRHHRPGADTRGGNRPAPRQRPAPGPDRRQPQVARRPHPPHSERTPIGGLVTMAEIADATDFLLRNTGINAHDLHMDGGLLAT